jgi:hypothetical protein
MITVLLSGGELGNLLFQYAVGRHLAIKNNTSLRLDLMNRITWRDILAKRTANELNSFGICAELYRPFLTIIGLRIRRYLGKDSLPYENKLFQEKNVGFDPAVLTLGDGACLSGLFQSEKYFKDSEQTIRNDLRLRRTSLDRECSSYRDEITNSNSVGVHIRRGDYIKSPLHNVCSISYFRKAIRYLQDRLDSPSFFIFSNDMEWCLNNIGISECRYVNSKPSPFASLVDFHLMRLCQHNVISNSTFSWWAAWLNDNQKKLIVTPSRWYSDEELNAQAMRDTVLDSWVRIDP